MEKQEPIAEGTSSQVQGSESRLPAPATPLIGRSSEVSLGCQLIEREGVRLVTLTGPGGIGKSRLAVRIATDLRDRFFGGVYWVSLEALHHAALVLPGCRKSTCLNLNQLKSTVCLCPCCGRRSRGTPSRRFLQNEHNRTSSTCRTVHVTLRDVI